MRGGLRSYHRTRYSVKESTNSPAQCPLSSSSSRPTRICDIDSIHSARLCHHPLVARSETMFSYEFEIQKPQTRGRTYVPTFDRRRNEVLTSNGKHKIRLNNSEAVPPSTGSCRVRGIISLHENVIATEQWPDTTGTFPAGPGRRQNSIVTCNDSLSRLDVAPGPDRSSGREAARAPFVPWTWTGDCINR